MFSQTPFAAIAYLARGFYATRSSGTLEVLNLIRATRQVGTPFLIPPGVAKEQGQLLRDGMTKTFRDPEFQKEYRKLTGDDVSPLTPEAQQETIRLVLRDAEPVGLFNLINGNKPLPSR